jgi:hypothetical protein
MLLANPAMKDVGSSFPNSKDRDPLLQQDDQFMTSKMIHVRELDISLDTQLTRNY